ncbi:MAG TPA: GTP 3',8-cyclase MoaA, partial [Thermoguttaceae bacterium]|nr:GTP 3',8-cyclase MoaA [Thermoguttaceae bacterium]
PLLPREAILDFDEIVRVVHVAARLGVRKVRLTGGEPLVRKNLPALIGRLAGEAGLADLAMTTNGTLLADYAQELRRAGLQRVNISLDTLDRRQFQALTGQDALDQVLQGIEAAQAAGFWPIKLNALAIRGFSESQIVPLVRFALERGLEIRFIEFMPIGIVNQWSPERVLPAAAILSILRREFGSVEPVDSWGPAESEAGREEETASAVSLVAATETRRGASFQPPARCYLLGDAGARIGIISSMSRPFCRSCGRLRLNAIGELRYCLFAQRGWDLRTILRRGGDDEELIHIFRAAVQAKPLRPNTPGQQPQTHLAMCQIGG